MQVLFKDQETAQQILQSDDPREQKQLGREVKNFKEEVWSKHCQGIVTKGNLAKVNAAMTTLSFFVITSSPET